MKKLFFILIIPFFLVEVSAQTVTLKKDYIVYRAQVCSGVSFLERKDVDVDNIFFMVNTPIKDKYGKTIGLLIENYSIKRPEVEIEHMFSGNLFPTENGFFGLKKNCEPFLIKKGNPFIADTIKWAFQNGPILIINGKKTNFKKTRVLDEFLDKKERRSAIGFNKFNEILVVISNNEVTIYDLISFLEKEECTNAIYLDGGISVGYRLTEFLGKKIKSFNKKTKQQEVLVFNLK